MNRPLTGVRVLDFTRVYSGPYATLLLSDMGAEVVKVEHPEGGDDTRAFGPFVAGTSGYFETLNRGKKSISIDYRSLEGQTHLRDLVGSFDILVENFRVGQMARYELDDSTLRGHHPRLIYASLSGYGQFGKYVERGCYDIVAQAMSGLMSLTGLPELPLKTGPAIADAISGLTLAVGILSALYGRERSGLGTHIDVAMVDAVFAVLENTLAQYSMTGEIPSRQGNIDSAIAPFDCFATRDNHIVLAIGNDRLWAKLVNLVGETIACPEFVTNAGRVVHYDRLRPILAAWCERFTASVLLECLHSVGIPAGAVMNIAELATDAHLEARDMLMKLPLEEEEQILVPSCPIHMNGVARPCAERAPRLGEHNHLYL